MKFDPDTSYRLLTPTGGSHLDSASEDVLWITAIWAAVVKNFIIRNSEVYYLRRIIVTLEAKLVSKVTNFIIPHTRKA